MPGVVQNSPHLTPGHEKDDFSVATIMSHAIAIWKPPAAAIPLTAHKTGDGNDLICFIRLQHSLKTV